jgi:hypothetical protein
MLQQSYGLMWQVSEEQWAYINLLKPSDNFTYDQV